MADPAPTPPPPPPQNHTLPPRAEAGDSGSSQRATVAGWVGGGWRGSGGAATSLYATAGATRNLRPCRGPHRGAPSPPPPPPSACTQRRARGRAHPPQYERTAKGGGPQPPGRVVEGGGRGALGARPPRGGGGRGRRRARAATRTAPAAWPTPPTPASATRPLDDGGRTAAPPLVSRPVPPSLCRPLPVCHSLPLSLPLSISFLSRTSLHAVTAAAAEPRRRAQQRAAGADDTRVPESDARNSQPVAPPTPATALLCRPAVGEGKEGESGRVGEEETGEQSRSKEVTGAASRGCGGDI